MNNNKPFSNKIVLITGDVSALSTGIIYSFLEEEAIVIVPVKSLHELNDVNNYKGNKSFTNLTTILIDVLEYNQAIDFGETIIEKYGKIDIAIEVSDALLCANLLTNLSMDEWLKMTDNNLTTLFISARVVLNSMIARKEGFFVSVTSDQLFDKNNRSPLTEIACDTRMKMSKIFADEVFGKNVRYYQLRVKSNYINPITGEPPVNDAEKIAAQIMKLYGKNEYHTEDVFQLVDASSIVK